MVEVEYHDRSKVVDEFVEDIVANESRELKLHCIDRPLGVV